MPVLRRRAPVLLDAPIAGGWWGDYEMTPDHNALIGEAAAPPGRFLYATGFSGHGFQQAPGRRRDRARPLPGPRAVRGRLSARGRTTRAARAQRRLAGPLEPPLERLELRGELVRAARRRRSRNAPAAAGAARATRSGSTSSSFAMRLGRQRRAPTCRSRPRPAPARSASRPPRRDRRSARTPRRARGCSRRNRARGSAPSSSLRNQLTMKIFGSFAPSRRPLASQWPK